MSDQVLARVDVPIVDGRLAPRDLEGMWRIGTALSKSGLLPKGLSTPEAAFVLVNTANELGIGFTDAISGIGVINGRPVLHSRLPTMLMQRHKAFAGMTETWTGLGPNGEVTDKASVRITVRRRNGEQIDEYHGDFSMADARTAGLLGRETYKMYPKDMLRSKARTRAIGGGFADALGGMGVVQPDDEAEIFAPVRRVANEAAPMPERSILDEPPAEGAASSQDAVTAAPSEVPFDPAKIAADMDNVKPPKRPAFDLDGNPVS